MVARALPIAKWSCNAAILQPRSKGAGGGGRGQGRDSRPHLPTSMSAPGKSLAARPLPRSTARTLKPRCGWGQAMRAARPHCREGLGRRAAGCRSRRDVLQCSAKLQQQQVLPPQPPLCRLHGICAVCWKGGWGQRGYLERAAHPALMLPLHPYCCSPPPRTRLEPGWPTLPLLHPLTRAPVLSCTPHPSPPAPAPPPHPHEGQ